ncbi:hypothetical protein F0L74_12525 [Chitinophaga agrisoli]|uniref:Immunity protein 51 of polymorphic toxin system n=1 Tax=Chitinophaga agrisoli TaxID=2607653 RepID=A0A5B2VYQ4_9BACT|nr:Imm51 family immunity protein [Chitinophaga agrisoli]KAA2243326.1 hypothetical protein F0L74_12525 [Chitinophaga agrisoli]
MEPYFPFQLHDMEGQFSIAVEIEREDLYPYYYLFERNDYEGNGYCWEAHATQIVEALDPELLSHIEFDSEAGGFFAFADTQANQEKFANLLSPIFADLERLEEWVKKADRSRIDD